METFRCVFKNRDNLSGNVSEEDLIRCGRWLNDRIIDAYLALLQENMTDKKVMMCPSTFASQQCCSVYCVGTDVLPDAGGAIALQLFQ